VETTRAPSWIPALALSLLLLGASVAFTELHTPAETDPLFVRWLRILAAHPWRSALALALLTWALCAGRKSVLSR
jgi:hypothetical protein